MGASSFAQDAAPPLAKLPTVHEEILRALDEAPLKLQFRGSTPAELAAWQREFGHKLSELIGPHTPPKAWKVRTLSTREFPDHTREELLLEASVQRKLRAVPAALAAALGVLRRVVVEALAAFGCALVR